MDRDSDESNNGDEVVDGGDVNINDGDDANWDDGESIIDCGDDKDGGGGGESISDGGVGNNGGSDSDFGDGETKIGCRDDTAFEDRNSNNDGGPSDGGVDANDYDCDGDDADSNVANGDKNDGDGGSNDDAKMVVEMMMMTKMVLILKIMMVLKTNFCNSIFLAFPQYLMGIYHFLVQMDLNNLCTITLCQVIGLSELSYDLALSSICWFHLYRISLGHCLPLKYYFFA